MSAGDDWSAWASLSAELTDRWDFLGYFATGTPLEFAPAEEDDDPNMNAGISAVFNAGAGDKTLLVARLCDPSVTLTMFEREWLARELLLGKGGRPRRNHDAVEAFIWLTQAEGMTKTKAYDAVWVAEGKRRQIESVRKEIRDDLKDGFKPDFGFWLSIERWRKGCRDNELRPRLLRDN